MLFPLGISDYLVGGLLIGVGVGVIYLFNGVLAGASSVFTTTWSYLTARPYFNEPEFKDTRAWRLVFAGGMIVGAGIFSIVHGAAFVTGLQWWRLAIGGLLVGFGTRLSRGCTSGHGICGLSSLSLTSLVAVVTFMAVGIGTALLVNSLGVAP